MGDDMGMIVRLWLVSRHLLSHHCVFCGTGGSEWSWLFCLIWWCWSFKMSCHSVKQQESLIFFSFFRQQTSLLCLTNYFSFLAIKSVPTNTSGDCLFLSLLFVAVVLCDTLPCFTDLVATCQAFLLLCRCTHLHKMEHCILWLTSLVI